MPFSLTRNRSAAAAALAALTLIAVPLAGCGGSDSDSSDTSSTASTSTVATAATTATTPTTATVPTDTVLTLPATTSTAAPAPDDESAAVRLVVVEYVGAFANADGARACGLLTTESQQAFLEEVKDLVDATSCADAFTQVTRDVPEPERVDFGRAEITDITVVGATATATLSLQGIANEVRLVRIAGSWKIANLPGT